MIAVGPGAPDKEGRVVPTAVNAGDRVLLPGWGGNAIKVGEEVRACFFFACAHGGADAFLIGVLFVQGRGHFGED